MAKTLASHAPLSDSLQKGKGASYLVDFWLAILEKELERVGKLIKYKESELYRLHNFSIDQLSKTHLHQINVLEAEINLLKGIILTIHSFKDECTRLTADVADLLLRLSCENDYLKKENKRLLEAAERINFLYKQEEILSTLYFKKIKTNDNNTE